jgi:hypothetical protein
MKGLQRQQLQRDPGGKREKDVDKSGVHARLGRDQERAQQKAEEAREQKKKQQREHREQLQREPTFQQPLGRQGQQRFGVNE